MDVEERFTSFYGPHFTWEEFRCKCEVCFKKTITPGVGNMDDGEWFQTPEFISFMAHLMHMRSKLGFPFIVNSGYRCPAANDQIYIDRGSPPGEHLDGPHTKAAADIQASFERAYKLNKMAAELELGIGLDQTGDVADRYIHVDNLGARLWTY